MYMLLDLRFSFRMIKKRYSAVVSYNNSIEDIKSVEENYRFEKRDG